MAVIGSYRVKRQRRRQLARGTNVAAVPEGRARLIPVGTVASRWGWQWVRARRGPISACGSAAATRFGWGRGLRRRPWRGSYAHWSGWHDRGAVGDASVLGGGGYRHAKGDQRACGVGGDPDALSGHLFVFCNRARTIVKALYWDHNGFCLWQKRLEADRFRWPGSEKEVLEIEPRQLLWLLSGLEVEQEGSHRRLSFGSAA